MPKNKSKTKGVEGIYPDADPTSPGGMSQKQLVTELVDEAGMDKAEAKALSWPEQIAAVAQHRQTIDLSDLDYRCDLHELQNCGECDGTAATHEASLTDQSHDLFDAIEHVKRMDLNEVAVSFPDDDIEAEFAEAQDEQAATQVNQPAPLFIGMPDTLDFIFDGHAGAGPSGAERWMNCTSSLGAARAFLETLSPNQQVQFAKSGDAARQGTTAHSAAEVKIGVMMGTVSPEEAEATLLELTIMPETEDEAYDSEMDEHLNEYVDLVQTYVDAGHDVLVEARVEAAVPLVGLHEGEVHVIPGSGDTIMMPTRKDPVLTVTDLKYGNGIDVGVDENPQVRIYGLGALALLTDDEGNLTIDIERVDYHIVQPRLGGIKTWSESVDDLLTWRDEVLAPALTAAVYGDNNLPEHQPTYVPSEEACQWCPARGGCAALAESRVEFAQDLFDVVVEAEFEGHDIAEGFPETGALTNDRLGALLAQVEGLVKIKDDLKEEAQRRLHRGDSVPGYQLVSYTPPRKWTENALSEIEHDPDLPALWKPKQLLTPKQALTLLGEQAELIEALIDTPDKRPVVAREGDRRKTWTGTPPEQMFPDTEEGA